MTVLEYLDEKHCRYQVTEHDPVYTAGQLATVEQVAPEKVAKPVAVRADGKYTICVSCRQAVRSTCTPSSSTSMPKISGLASEHEMELVFTDSELGAEPPFGNLYHLPTLMDKRLAKDRKIVFQAGSHKQAIWMSMSEYKRLANPTVFAFSYPEAIEEIESMPLDPFFYDPFGI